MALTADIREEINTLIWEAIKQFGKAQIKAISDNTRGGYLLGSNSMSAIQMALVPPNVAQEFPRMIYKRTALGGGDETRIVNDNEELLAVLEQGWSRTPSPEPPGFPQNWVEHDRARGSDLRRVLIRNAKELELFMQVVELHPITGRPRHWGPDAQYAWAGRGVPLSDLVEERRTKLKSLIDQDLLEVVSENVGDADEPSREAESASEKD